MSDPLIPVFFNREAVVRVDSCSPSAFKPALVMEGWLRKYTDKLSIHTHEPAEIEELDFVHDQRYVRDVMALRIPNGFGTRQADVPRSLLFTTGGMIHAAQAALERDYGAVAVPYSGFHHAGRDFGGGFCTFNGLMAAAVNVLEHQMCQSVLILDCDYHYGDGTQDIIDRGDLEVAGVYHWTAGRDFHFPNEAPQFFDALKKVIFDHKHVDLVLYQAGADVHIKDPLGGFLTTKQMQERDRLVFESFNDAGIPVVWNLAGGYQTPVSRVLALHDQTMRECIRANIG